MPFDARWRCSKIVVPVVPSREEELVGGLKNAIDRGETLAKAKQSFVSAGYKPAEVAMAAQKIPTANSQIGKQVVMPSKISTKPQKTSVKATSLPITPAVAGQQKTLSKKFKIILISISVIVLIGAAVLGIFWNKIF